jgi:hypothetical protein
MAQTCNRPFNASALELTPTSDGWRIRYADDPLRDDDPRHAALLGHNTLHYQSYQHA